MLGLHDIVVTCDAFSGIFGKEPVWGRRGDAVGEPRKLLNSTSNSRFMKREVLRFVVVRQQDPGVVHALG